MSINNKLPEDFYSSLILGGMSNKIVLPKDVEVNNILNLLMKNLEEEKELIKQLKKLIGD